MANPDGWKMAETHAPDSLPIRVERARSADQSRAHDCAIELRFSLSRIELDRFGDTGYIPAWARDIFQPSDATLSALRAMVLSERY